MSARMRTGVVLVLLTAAATHASAQDDLSAALTLYRDADYVSALELATAHAGGDSIEADRIGALCLLALGRADEAEILIERVVVARPNYEPAAEESPRVRSTFRAVRMRVLPAKARQGYEQGRAAFEYRRFAEAAATFQQTLPLLEILALEGRRDMEDLRLLASDFLSLSRLLTPPPPEVATPPLSARRITDAPIPAAATMARAESPNR